MAVPVYLGTWWDFTRSDAFLQYTLTLPPRYGPLLGSALVIIINVAGGAVWSIFAFFLHQSHATLLATDGFEQQLRGLLRNHPSHYVMLWELFCLWRTWREKTTKVGRRILAAAIWPALIALGFAIASIFVAKAVITADKVANVLILPSNCGLVNATTGPYTAAQALSAKIANDTRIASARVDTCSGDSSLGCIGLPVRQLGFTSSIVDCPFAGSNRCVSPAIRLTSNYINSNFHLGINAPRDQQVNFRISQTCSVLSTRDVTRSVVDSSVSGGQANILLISLGPTTIGTSYTFSYPTRYVNNSLPYTIQTVYSYAGAPNASVWTPSSDVKVNFADVILHAISANSLQYVYPTTDPMFSANGTYKTLGSDGASLYLPDHYVSVTACTEQFEYSYPNNNNASTGLAGYVQTEASIPNMGFNPMQLATAERIHNAAWSARNVNTVSGQGVNALQATKQLYLLTSSRLPSNQYEIEYTHWFQTGLTNLLARIVDFPTNSWYSSDSEASTGLTVRPPKSFPGAPALSLYNQCGYQRVLSEGEYTNFYFSAVILVVVACGLLVVISWVLPWLWSKLPNRIAARSDREAGAQRYRYLYWVADHQYNLMRAAVGGTWQAGNTTSPYQDGVTEDRESFRPPVESESSIDFHRTPIHNQELQQVRRDMPDSQRNLLRDGIENEDHE